MKVFITGANRGIGFEFCRQMLLPQFGIKELVATVREPARATELKTLAAQSGGRLHVIALDLADDSNPVTRASGLVERLKAAGLGAGPSHFDGIINNAGIYLDEGASIDKFDFDAFRKSFEVNALGAFKVLKSLGNLIAPGSRIFQITSLMASIGDNRGGGSYAYRASKAALNMMNRCYTIERPDVISVAIHPGWVQTDMGGSNAPISPESSVSHMLEVYRKLKPSDSGKFLNYDGAELPW